MSKDYHGQKPTDDEDKKIAEDHLERTHDMLEEQHDLNDDKIDDHKKLYKKALKAGNMKKAKYHKGHFTGHGKDNDELDKKLSENERSQSTLKNLSFNDVRKGKVNKMLDKAGVS